MQTARVRIFSRLRLSKDVVTPEGYQYWSNPFPPYFELDGSETKYTVREDERLDMIAFQFYNDPELWWVIALINEMLNPFDFSTGDTLLIPSLEFVKTKLLVGVSL